MYLVCDSRPVGEDPALEESPHLALDEPGDRTVPALLAGEEGLESLADGLVQDQLLGVPWAITVVTAGDRLPTQALGRRHGELPVPMPCQRADPV
jgi:hypothetical protein